MNRYRNHKSKRKKLSFISTVIFLSIIILLSSSNSSFINISENAIGTVTNSVSKFFYYTFANSKEVFKKIFGTQAIRKENEDLKSENIKLKEQISIMENVISKEEFLKDEYNLSSQSNKSLIKTYVVGRDTSSLFIRFTIDKGSKDGVSVGDIIVQGATGESDDNYIEAVVGKVVEVGYNWSKVSSLVDTTSNISFKVVRTQDYGVISGQENYSLSGFMYKSDGDGTTDSRRAPGLT